MLSELCGYLRNWFDRDKYIGDFTINNGVIIPLGDKSMNLLNGQYIRIVGSVLNDGIYEYNSTKIEGLKDETFSGAIWSLAIPKEVVALAEEINAWQTKYGGADSAAVSPFSNESFGGYSYTKSTGNAENGSNGLGGWQSAYANRLNQWRKI